MGNGEKPTTQRVLGFDLLRGLCALAVALFHTLGALGGPQLYVYGTYGVYVFSFCLERVST